MRGSMFIIGDNNDGGNCSTRQSQNNKQHKKIFGPNLTNYSAYLH